MEYRKEFRAIQFRIVFSHHPHERGSLTFAAQPYELLDGTSVSNEPSNYMLYGKVSAGEYLEVGFNHFTFEMTNDLHKRLGDLYQIIKQEYKNHIIRKT